MNIPSLDDERVRPAARLRAGLFAGLMLLSLATLRCSADGGAAEAPSGTGANGTASPREEFPLNLGTNNGEGGAATVPLDPLCGAGECVPDGAEACEGAMGGAGGASGVGFGGAGGGLTYDPGDLDGQGLSCKVAGDPSCTGEQCDVVRSCLPSGASEAGEPCVAGADCAAGLACVGDGLSGICRPYCCEGTARSCAEGTFCDEQRLPDSQGIYVPVCLPVDGCSLSEPFPCPEGQECTCQGDRACVVVRADGATACTLPGSGRAGDPCTGLKTAECAHGFVCSPSAGCIQLCSRTLAADEASDCPDGGYCQPLSELPADIGVCVGASSGSGAAR